MPLSQNCSTSFRNNVSLRSLLVYTEHIFTRLECSNTVNCRIYCYWILGYMSLQNNVFQKRKYFQLFRGETFSTLQLRKNSILETEAFYIIVDSYCGFLNLYPFLQAHPSFQPPSFPTFHQPTQFSPVSNIANKVNNLYFDFIFQPSSLPPFYVLLSASFQRLPSLPSLPASLPVPRRQIIQPFLIFVLVNKTL